MKGKIFITGGAGTLGRAIIERGRKEEWDAEFSVYSTDPTKHHRLLADHPHVISIIGDILDYNALATAMAGHDIVIHAAAMKFIPEGEKYPHYTFEVNVTGSHNVIQAALQTKIKQVVGISTDKACHPVNAYGASKMMMERLFQEAARGDLVSTKFYLVRYGNVLGSSGSFIHNWKRELEKTGKVISTNPDMTRFWLTIDSAVHLIERAIIEDESGIIRVPYAKGASIGNIEEWLLGHPADEHMGMRPGEKMHETLITREEQVRTRNSGAVFFIHPPNRKYATPTNNVALVSNDPSWQLKKEEFIEMIGGWK